MSATWIKIPTQSGSMDGFLALPHQKKGPAILLIQEIFGVNAHIRQVAEQYALAGFVVLAPDLFWQHQARIELAYDQNGVKQGVDLMQARPIEAYVEYLRAAAHFLNNQTETSAPLTSIGYCFGGSLAYLAASEQFVDASIAYYGGQIHHYLDRAPQIKVPLMLHYAENDHSISLDAISSVQQAFKNHSNISIHTYPGTHGFNCNWRSSYHQPAATCALGRSLTFLSQLL